MKKNLINSIIFFLTLFGYQFGLAQTSSMNKGSSDINKKISQLVNMKNIGQQVSYLEKMFSLVTIRKNKNNNSYKIETCEVNLTYDKRGNVTIIKGYAGAKCSIDTEVGNTSSLTMDQIISVDKKNNWKSRILTNCISSCGRTQEPEYVYLSPGASANGYIATAISFTNVSGAEKWIDNIKLVLKIENFDDDELINCTDKFDNFAMNQLKGGDITSVTISASKSVYWNEYPIICKK
jgi:hypothetical protein